MALPTVTNPSATRLQPLSNTEAYAKNRQINLYYIQDFPASTSKLSDASISSAEPFNRKIM
jgi:hypothetical protein